MLRETLRGLTLVGAFAAQPALQAYENVRTSVRGEVEGALEPETNRPVHLIIIGDVSASLSREARPDIISQMEQFLGALRLGRDFLKVYVLGTPRAPETPLRSFGHEELEFMGPGAPSMDEETLRAVRAALYEQFFARRGEHSDSLWVLRRISENLAKENTEGRRNVLVFFSDFEPDSWDDIDWRRYPELEKLSPQERIDQYHAMVAAELEAMTQRGVEIHLMPSNGTPIPAYAAAYTGTPFDKLLASLRPRAKAVRRELVHVPVSHERDPGQIRAAAAAAQARDRDLIALSVLTNLSLAGLGVTLRKQKKAEAEVGARLDDLLHGTLPVPMYLPLLPPDESLAPRPALVPLLLRIGDERPAPRRNEVAESLAELRALAPQRNLASPEPEPRRYPSFSTLVMDELRDVLTEVKNGVAVGDTPRLRRATQLTALPPETPPQDQEALLAIFTELLEAADERLTTQNTASLHYFFGPQDYRAFAAVVEDFSGQSIDASGQTSIPFNTLALSSYVDAQLPSVNGQKHAQLLRVKERILGTTLYTPRNQFFVVHQTPSTKDRRDSRVSLKPSTHIRACIPDASKKPPSSLIIEWDRDKLKLFRVRTAESGRFFSPARNDTHFESDRFDMNGGASFPQVCVAIDEVLTALRAT